MRMLAAAVLLTLAGCSDDGSSGSTSAATPSIHLVSVGPARGPGNSWSDAPSISADGRLVAFESPSEGLTPDDSNDVLDVFVRDVAGGTTSLVSANTMGEAGNDFSHEASISPDGRYVAFTSRATNLVPGDRNDQEDVFVRDLAVGTTVRVSMHSDGTEGDSYSHHPSISAGGRFVAFESRAANLVADDTNDAPDVFVRDLVARTTVRVSVDSAGRPGGGATSNPAISADGRFVVFESSAPLAEDNRNEFIDVYRHDRFTGATERVSTGRFGREGNGDSTAPAVSGDGRFVAFESLADNLVDGDVNQETDVFVRDMTSGETACVSMGADGPCREASLSADGRRVAFSSPASNLDDGDLKGVAGIFIRDLATGTTLLASTDLARREWSSHCGAPALAGEGRHVAFSSVSYSVVDGDFNGTLDVYLRGPLE